VLEANSATGTGVELTVTDRAGNVVGRMVTAAGDTTSLTLTLTAGDYTVRMGAFRADGKPLTPVQYVLRGIVQSDPIGPQAEDTTDEPPPPTRTTTTDSTPQTEQSPPAQEPTTTDTTYYDDSYSYDDGYSYYDSTSWYYWSAPEEDSSTQYTEPEPSQSGPTTEESAGGGYRV
jgi:hypothetical protein